MRTKYKLYKIYFIGIPAALLWGASFSVSYKILISAKAISGV